MSGLEISEQHRRALAQLGQYPLLDAIIGRRSRRFPVGGSIPDGPLAYTSTEEARSITEVERALIISVLAGVTGWNFGITRHPGYAPKTPNYPGSAGGRTFPSAAAFHTSQLFFTDDSGTYFFGSRDAPPQLERQDEPADLESWITSTAEQFRQLSTERLVLPREEPYMEGHNTWIANWPGSLLAFPVADLSEHLVANLNFFAANGYVIFDDVHDNAIPGIEQFSGLRHFDDPVPLTFVEQYTLAEASAELATATNTGVLLLQALGLGGWTFDGLDRLSVLGAGGDPRAPGLGFSYDSDERWPFPNATGLKGVFETLVPPFTDSVAAGVAKYYQRKFGPGGPGHPDTPGPWSDSPKIRGEYLPGEGLREAVTLQAEYIYNRFGKLPGTVPTVHVLMYLQAQNLDRGFYDQKFGPGAYLPTHTRHDDVWS